MLSSKVLSCPFKGASSLHSRSICHKTKLKPKSNNYHWPYERRSWTFLNFWLDPNTKAKFDENTKIIQVEGNINAGKEKFARQLAEELGMAYFPQPDLESYYVNKHGFDYRALNPLLPERLRLCDWEMFHQNPSRHSAMHMQYYLFRLRAFQYQKAIAHLFNTGQGVVMTRSVFTERAIVEAMHNVGWLPKGYVRGDGVRFYDWKNRYIFQRNMALARTHKPHLIIYLDTPVGTCLERSKNDPDPIIATSNAITREFLEEVETAFKDVVLPKQDHNGHVLMVDHPDHKTLDEVKDVIDDIEGLNFEFDWHETRFEDWNEKSTLMWHHDTRKYFTSLRYARDLNMALDAPWFDIAGLGDSITQGDLILRKSLFEGHVDSLGLSERWETDVSLHGMRAIFGKLLNFGEQLDKYVRVDFK